MLYVWVKAFHVVAVITWIAGLLVVAGVLAALPSFPMQGTDRQHAAQVVRAWDRAVTTPAMLLVWAFGLTLALRGRWFAAAAGRPPAAWLPAKLVFVLALSALHGMQAGALRRLAGGAALPAARATRVAPALILGMVAVIVVLVILKPF